MFAWLSVCVFKNEYVSKIKSFYILWSDLTKSMDSKLNLEKIQYLFQIIKNCLKISDFSIQFVSCLHRDTIQEVKWELSSHIHTSKIDNGWIILMRRNIFLLEHRKDTWLVSVRFEFYRAFFTDSPFVEIWLEQKIWNFVISKQFFLKFEFRTY